MWWWGSPGPWWSRYGLVINFNGDHWHTWPADVVASMPGAPPATTCSSMTTQHPHNALRWREGMPAALGHSACLDAIAGHCADAESSSTSRCWPRPQAPRRRHPPARYANDRQHQPVPPDHCHPSLPEHQATTRTTTQAHHTRTSPPGTHKHTHTQTPVSCLF